ncbi:hypothetical protein NL523_27610, partial [Klebsiella pneumoniae]|nr:hypothetical protein [Klebsiella pneumoniae]MCP6663516.1 hypothetical protein [Klebsiella pneumoniae]
MIKEVIVVEGKQDIAAVKWAVDAECIATDGFNLLPRTISRIETVSVLSPKRSIFNRPISS